ncbi:hypothetical protein T09_1751, partial [Trichinella sp. T9]
LCLVPNRGSSMAFVFEGRAYKLKHTGKQKKCWRCSKDKKDCKGAVWTDLEVTAVINRKDHVETCQVDEHLAYKMEKKALFKKRSAEETKPSPQYIMKKPLPRLLNRLHPDSFRFSSGCKPQCTNIGRSASPDFLNTNMICLKQRSLGNEVQGCYFHFCQAVHRKVGELGLKTQYRQHEETRRKIRMLLATAFLPVP